MGVIRNFFTLGFLSMILLSCGAFDSLGSGSSSSQNESSGQSTWAVGGQITELATSSSDFTVDATDVSDEDDLVLVVFNTNQSSTSHAFGVGASVNASLLVDDADEDNDESVYDEELGAYNVTEELHSTLRALEEELVGGDYEMANTKYATKALEVKEGDTQEFFVLNSFSTTTFDKVTATLVRQTEVANFYIDNEALASLPEEDFVAMVDEFSAVYPAEQKVFGVASDVNGDGRFDVVFTPVVNRLGGNGGFATGFFYAADLLAGTNSNSREVIFSCVPDPQKEFSDSAVSLSFFLNNIGPNVLVHEAQHMISFNMHYFVNQGASEVGWVNEGLSHLAEDLFSNGKENPVRVRNYFSKVDTTNFMGGTSLAQRGGAYLFFRYWYDQAEQGLLPNTAVIGGEALLQSLTDTNLRGINNVLSAVMGGTDTSALKELVGRPALAYYYSDTGLFDEPELAIDGINLRETQDDNRGTVLNGPAVHVISSFPFTQSIQGTGISYVQISGSLVKDNGGQIPLSFGGSDEFGAYLIR